MLASAEAVEVSQPSFLRYHEDETDLWIVFVRYKNTWCWRASSIWFTRKEAREEVRKQKVPAHIVCVPVRRLLDVAVSRLHVTKAKRSA